MTLLRRISREDALISQCLTGKGSFLIGKTVLEWNNLRRGDIDVERKARLRLVNE